MRIIKTVVAGVLVLIVTATNSNAQTASKAENAAKTEQVKLYDPTLDGMKQIKDGIALAKKANKHVLIQYGGNWCGWGIMFDGFCKADTSISRIINENYIPGKLIWSPENKNDASNEYLGKSF